MDKKMDKQLYQNTKDNKNDNINFNQLQNYANIDNISNKHKKEYIFGNTTYIVSIQNKENASEDVFSKVKRLILREYKQDVLSL